MTLSIFMIISCEKNNDNMKLINKEMENKIENLEKENNIKNTKIQNLMGELSTCKASKVKYVENKEDFDIIDGNDNSDNLGNNSNTENIDKNPPNPDNLKKVNTENLDKTQVDKIEEKNIFPYPDDIKGECRKSDINRVFHNLRKYYDKCCTSQKIKRGKLGFSWNINENGKVENIKVIKNNIFNKNLSNCLKVVLSSGRYNSPKQGICEIKYVFNLR